MYHSLRNRLGVGETVLGIYTKDKCCTNVVWPPLSSKYQHKNIPPVHSLYFAIIIYLKCLNRLYLRLSNEFMSG